MTSPSSSPAGKATLYFCVGALVDFLLVVMIIAEDGEGPIGNFFEWLGLDVGLNHIAGVGIVIAAVVFFGFLYKVQNLAINSLAKGLLLLTSFLAQGGIILLCLLVIALTTQGGHH